mgnify:CR=1 FL=1
MKTTIFAHITIEMIIAFTLGISCLFLYTWKSSTDNKYMKLTLPNVLFHFVASVMVFLGLHELGEIIIENYIPVLKGNNSYHYTLACLTGMFGSVLVAWVLTKRNNITKKEETNSCKHD